MTEGSYEARLLVVGGRKALRRLLGAPYRLALREGDAMFLLNEGNVASLGAARNGKV